MAEIHEKDVAFGPCPLDMIEEVTACVNDAFIKDQFFKLPKYKNRTTLDEVRGMVTANVVSGTPETYLAAIFTDPETSERVVVGAIRLAWDVLPAGADEPMAHSPAAAPSQPAKEEASVPGAIDPLSSPSGLVSPIPASLPLSSSSGASGCMSPKSISDRVSSGLCDPDKIIRVVPDLHPPALLSPACPTVRGTFGSVAVASRFWGRGWGKYIVRQAEGFLLQQAQAREQAVAAVQEGSAAAGDANPAHDAGATAEASACTAAVSTGPACGGVRCVMEALVLDVRFELPPWYRRQGYSVVCTGLGFPYPKMLRDEYKGIDGMLIRKVLAEGAKREC